MFHHHPSQRHDDSAESLTGLAQKMSARSRKLLARKRVDNFIGRNPCILRWIMSNLLFRTCGIQICEALQFEEP